MSSNLTPLKFPEAKREREGEPTLPYFEDGEITVTSWSLSLRQIWRIFKTRRIWVVMRTIEQPPVTITVDKPIE